MFTLKISSNLPMKSPLKFVIYPQQQEKMHVAAALVKPSYPGPYALKYVPEPHLATVSC